VSPRRAAEGEENAPPIYSVTSLAIYEACPWQYYITFVRHIPPPRSRARDLGTSVHKVIADHLRTPHLIPVPIQGDAATLFDHFLHSRFNVTPLACETPFRLRFSPGDVRGRIDTITPRPSGGVEVVDFKTGSGQGRDDLGQSLQLPLYALAAQERYGLPPEDLSWTYFYLSDEVEYSFDGAAYDFAALRERVEHDMINIQAGRFDSADGCTCWACTRWARGAGSRR
jgi:hypothetical protein